MHPEFIMSLDKVFDVFFEYDQKDNKKLIFIKELKNYKPVNKVQVKPLF